MQNNKINMQKQGISEEKLISFISRTYKALKKVKGNSFATIAIDFINISLYESTSKSEITLRNWMNDPVKFVPKQHKGTILPVIAEGLNQALAEQLEFVSELKIETEKCLTDYQNLYNE